MKTTVALIVTLLTTLGVVLIPPAEAASDRAGCATIEALRAEEGGDLRDSPNRVLIAVSATNCSVDAARLSIRLSDGASETIKVISLPKGTGRIWRFHSNGGSYDTLIQGTVHSANRGSVAQLVLPAPRPTHSSEWTSTVIVAALGLLGTLGATWAVERSTHRRERRSQALAWNAVLFDRYEPSYRTFLSTWSGSSDARLLRAAFADLRRQVVVPPSVEKAVRETVTVLEGQTSPTSKEHAAKSLYRRMAEALRDPAGLGG